MFPQWHIFWEKRGSRYLNWFFTRQKTHLLDMLKNTKEKYTKTVANWLFAQITCIAGLK